MGRCLVSTTGDSARFCQIPRLMQSLHHPKQSIPKGFSSNSQPLRGFQNGFCRTLSFSIKPTRTLCTKAVLSERQFSRVGAESTGPIPSSQLLEVVETAAKTGAKEWKEKRLNV
ncbi:unnamed protein product [Ilex paraguariensis]|uniref:Uncharacterized protein n=1 Tax=Ilex paraguariensis TaxID=185542 RepID=A0ABC8V1D7_9AQUA